MLTVSEIEKHIIYEKDGLIALNKPHGIPTSGLSMDDPRCLQYTMIQRHGGMVWAVHQLDADTSGVNLFVTEKKMVQQYKNALEKTNSDKFYYAIVHGNPSWNEVEELGAIGKVDERSLGITEDGKSAHSKFTVLSRNENYALVQAQIFSGRTHQIRIHLSHLGHPLVGEEWYIDEACQTHHRQALHCLKIDLYSKEQSFIAELPNDFKKLAENLNLKVSE